MICRDVCNDTKKALVLSRNGQGSEVLLYRYNGYFCRQHSRDVLLKPEGQYRPVS